MGDSVPWRNIMINVGISWVPCGVILSTMGDNHDACGGYHEYYGGVQYRGGENFFVIWVPHGPEHPLRYPHIYYDIPQVLKLWRMVSPRCSRFSPRYWVSPMALKIIPPRYSRFPHMHHDIPHGTERPPQYCTYPHGTAHTLIIQGGSAKTKPFINFWVPGDFRLWESLQTSKHRIQTRLDLKCSRSASNKHSPATISDDKDRI